MSVPAWCWFGMVTTTPEDALAVAEARDRRGDLAGLLAAWPGEQPHRPGASHIDRRVIDRDGPAMAVSLTSAPDGDGVLFDDPAVVAATTAAMARPWPAFVSTLSADAAHIAGAVYGVEAATAAAWEGWWDLDPFARVLEVSRLHVAPGLFTRVPPPAGPGHQRYGGAPWPVSGFASR